MGCLTYISSFRLAPGAAAARPAKKVPPAFTGGTRKDSGYRFPTYSAALSPRITRPGLSNRNRRKPVPPPFPNAAASFMLCFQWITMIQITATAATPIRTGLSCPAAAQPAATPASSAARKTFPPFQHRSNSSYAFRIGMTLCQPGFHAFLNKSQRPTTARTAHAVLITKEVCSSIIIHQYPDARISFVPESIT